jgi:hypothetical protein
MTESAPATASTNNPSSDDYARITVDTPFNAGELITFFKDGERLLRINPLYHFERFERLEGDRYRIRLNNHSNGKTLDTEIAIEHAGSGIVLHYGEGIKSRTEIHIVPGSPENGPAQIVLTDFYDRYSEQENQTRLDDVDRSIEPWGRGLHRYLGLWKRWSWLAPWRWYMTRAWLPMRPMARRIAFFLIVITLAEIVIFLMIFVIFALELDRHLQI